MNIYWRQYFEELDRIMRQIVDASNDHETRITDLEP